MPAIAALWSPCRPISAKLAASDHEQRGEAHPGGSTPRRAPTRRAPPTSDDDAERDERPAPVERRARGRRRSSRRRRRHERQPERPHVADSRAGARGRTSRDGQLGLQHVMQRRSGRAPASSAPGSSRAARSTHGWRRRIDPRADDAAAAARRLRHDHAPARRGRHRRRGRGPDPEPVISVRGLRKAYGPQVAVHGIDLEVAPRRDRRRPGPQRRRQDDHRRDPRGLPRRRRGRGRVLGEDPAGAPRGLARARRHRPAGVRARAELTVRECLEFTRAVPRARAGSTRRSRWPA